MNPVYIQEELRELKRVLNNLLIDKAVLVNDIKEAESHILNGDNNAFWNPKLAQLREDKQYLNTTEMQLREQILMRERLSFSDQIQATPSIPTTHAKPRFSTESTEPIVHRRPRSGTWSGDADMSKDDNKISKLKYDFTIRRLKSIEEVPSPVVCLEEEYKALSHQKPANRSSLKRTLSCPGLMTQSEPPEGGWKHKGAEVEKIIVRDFVQYQGQFNVFGVSSNDDEDEITAPQDSDNEVRNSGDETRSSPNQVEISVPKPAGFLSMAGILQSLQEGAISSFRFAESLVITQNYEEEEEIAQNNSGKGMETIGADSFKFAESLIITQSNEEEQAESDAIEAEEGDVVPVVLTSHKETLAPRRTTLGVAPNVSNHDFSVFGVDLDEDEN